MNKMISKTYKIMVGALVFLSPLLFTSCNEEEEAPQVNSVWINMASRPVEQISCAYPSQTICMRGQHLGNLKRVIVNGTDINLNTLFVYESDAAITFQLPADVNTQGDNIRVVTQWGMTDHPFIVRPTAEKPIITAFSSTTLIAGRTLTITGENLEGAKEVWLPLTFGGRTQCDITAADSVTVAVTIPDNVSFATGLCEILMEKTDSVRGITYTEKVYSSETNFK